MDTTTAPCALSLREQEQRSGGSTAVRPPIVRLTARAVRLATPAGTPRIALDRAPTLDSFEVVSVADLPSPPHPNAPLQPLARFATLAAPAPTPAPTHALAETPPPSARATTLARFTDRLRARWPAAAGVMFTPLLVGWALPALLEPGCRGTIPRLLFLAIEGPIVTFALAHQLDRASRRPLRARRLLPASLALAALLGGVCAYAAWMITVALGLEFQSFQQGEPLTLPRVVIFGAVVGALQLVLWAVTFAYPLAVEDARVRALESERLRLETETLRLESEQLRASAELAGLRSQLEPHFLLNTLNAIAGLVTHHPREARRLLGSLGDLLRGSLRDVDELQPLSEELSWLEKYAQILESRHADALTFRWEIDEAARVALLPRWLLQPLVENAVNHGALQRGAGGVVCVRGRVETTPRGTQLVCEIEDNGPGLPAEPPRPAAVGLRSVRRRVALNFPDGDFDIASTQDGTICRLRLPLQLHPSPQEPAVSARS